MLFILPVVHTADMIVDRFQVCRCLCVRWWGRLEKAYGSHRTKEGSKCDMDAEASWKIEFWGVKVVGVEGDEIGS